MSTLEMFGVINCTLNQEGEVVDRGRFRTTPKAIAKWFMDLPSTRVAMEAGVHSIWISEQLQELGHEVIVAIPRMLSVKCSNQFSRVEVGKRNDLDFSKAELPLYDGPDCP